MDYNYKKYDAVEKRAAKVSSLAELIIVYLIKNITEDAL